MSFIKSLFVKRPPDQPPPATVSVNKNVLQVPGKTVSGSNTVSNTTQAFSVLSSVQSVNLNAPPSRTIGNQSQFGNLNASNATIISNKITSPSSQTNVSENVQIRPRSQNAEILNHQMLLGKARIGDVAAAREIHSMGVDQFAETYHPTLFKSFNTLLNAAHTIKNPANANNINWFIAEAQTRTGYTAENAHDFDEIKKFLDPPISELLKTSKNPVQTFQNVFNQKMQELKTNAYVDFLKPAAKNGDAEAMFCLVKHFQADPKISENYLKGLVKAADLGNAAAMYYAVLHYFSTDTKISTLYFELLKNKAADIKFIDPAAKWYCGDMLCRFANAIYSAPYALSESEKQNAHQKLEMGEKLKDQAVNKFNFEAPHS